MGGDRDGPDTEALYNKSLNGSNGHPAPEIEVSPFLAHAEAVPLKAQSACAIQAHFAVLLSTAVLLPNVSHSRPVGVMAVLGSIIVSVMEV